MPETKTTSTTPPKTPREDTKLSGPPGRVLPNSWLKHYIDYAGGMEAPALFHLWTGLSTLASIVGRKVKAVYGNQWDIYPNLYVILVSPQGHAKKSSAIMKGQDLFDYIDGVNVLQDKMSPEGLIAWLKLQGQKQAASTKAQKEQKSDAAKSSGRIKLDLEPECVGTIIARDLITLLSKQNYVSGLVELLTKLFNCRSTEYTTKSALDQKQSIRVPNPCVNILAASTQRYLAKCLAEDSLSGGFTSRSIFVASKTDKIYGWRKMMEHAHAQDGLRDLLVHDLHRIKQLSGEMKATDEAIDRFDEWYEPYKEKLRSSTELSKTRVSGYFERKDVYVVKLAMLVSIAESDNLVMLPEHIDTALKFLKLTERTMEDAFAFVGATTAQVVAEHILEALWLSENHAMLAGDLLEAIRYLIKNKREFDEIMQLLCEGGHVVYGYADRKPAYALTKAHIKDRLEREKRLEAEMN